MIFKSIEFQEIVEKFSLIEKQKIINQKIKKNVPFSKKITKIMVSSFSL